MKIIQFLMLLMCMNIFFVPTIKAEDPPPIEHWGPEDNRSQCPQRPIMSVDDSALLIHFVDKLDNLAVCVKTISGTTVFQSVISGAAGETVAVPLVGGQQENYCVMLSHNLGWVIWEFSVQ